MTHTITLIPGDGIGPEVTAAVLKILAATGVSISSGTPTPPECWRWNVMATRCRLS